MNLVSLPMDRTRTASSDGIKFTAEHCNLSTSPAFSPWSSTTLQSAFESARICNLILIQAKSLRTENGSFNLTFVPIADIPHYRSLIFARYSHEREEDERIAIPNCEKRPRKKEKRVKKMERPEATGEFLGREAESIIDLVSRYGVRWEGKFPRRGNFRSPRNNNVSVRGCEGSAPPINNAFVINNRITRPRGEARAWTASTQPDHNRRPGVRTVTMVS